MLVWKKLYVDDGVLYGKGWFSQPVRIRTQDILNVYFWPGGGVWGWGVLAVKTTAGNFKVNILSKQFSDVLGFLAGEGVHLPATHKYMMKAALVVNEWRLPRAHVKAIEAAIEGGNKHGVQH
jgi:hypothetical protein